MKELPIGTTKGATATVVTIELVVIEVAKGEAMAKGEAIAVATHAVAMRNAASPYHGEARRALMLAKLGVANR